MEKVRVFIVLFWFAAWTTGCAVPVKEEPRAVPDVSAGYLQTAKQQEAAGEPISALKHFRLALTVNPDNQEAIAGCQRLENELRSLAERHYNAGLHLQKTGQYAPAKREFLIALRLWPDHPEALKMITPKKRAVAKDAVVHTVQPGETLSALAARYYGDYRKFDIIAQHNQLNDSASLRVGQKLMIPGTATPDRGESPGAVEEAWADGRGMGGDKSEDPANVAAEMDYQELFEAYDSARKANQLEQIAIYRDHGIELYNDKAYEAAIVEFNKVLAATPNDPVALDYLYQCHFHQSMALYVRKEYLAARDGFRTTLKFKGNCQQCHAYMDKCEASYKAFHYTRGMQFYHNEQLEEAIREWELVKREDPDYKKVTYLIDKARTIQEKMNELKAKEGKR
jgi:tetratricopeptide (TPR) repeat protein